MSKKTAKFAPKAKKAKPAPKGQGDDESEAPVNDDVEIQKDEASGNADIPPQVRFSITSFGWDPDVEGLVSRLDRNDIYKPGFQRGLVWTPADKSRFIESLILGLPVPTIFLAEDSETKRLNIVDGQQRLRTLQQYLHGEFKLAGKTLQPDLVGRYYSAKAAKSDELPVLSETDFRTLTNALIPAIVVKSDPRDDDKDKGHEYNRAIIQLFKRLNTSGRPLTLQEVRSSIFHGAFDEMLRSMNKEAGWRKLFGKEHSRLRDMEIILRYLALLESWKNYKPAMPLFLDNYMESHRNIDKKDSERLEAIFEEACKLVLAARGPLAFKTGTTFLLSTFDAVMVGISTAIKNGKKVTVADVKAGWAQLDKSKVFQSATKDFVNDKNKVFPRIKLAIKTFG